MIERYRVYWASLDPVRGGEMAKTRPVVVISDDAMNRNLGTVVVCPLTTSLHPRWPSRVQARVGGREAEVAVDQIRSLDKARLGGSLGKLRESVAAELRHVITQMYGVLSVES